MGISSGIAALHSMICLFSLASIMVLVFGFGNNGYVHRQYPIVDFQKRKIPSSVVGLVTTSKILPRASAQTSQRFMTDDGKTFGIRSDPFGDIMLHNLKFHSCVEANDERCKCAVSIAICLVCSMMNFVHSFGMCLFSVTTEVGGLPVDHHSYQNSELCSPCDCTLSTNWMAAVVAAGFALIGFILSLFWGIEYRVIGWQMGAGLFLCIILKWMGMILYVHWILPCLLYLAGFPLTTRMDTLSRKPAKGLILNNNNNKISKPLLANIWRRPRQYGDIDIRDINSVEKVMRQGLQQGGGNDPGDPLKPPPRIPSKHDSNQIIGDTQQQTGQEEELLPGGRGDRGNLGEHVGVIKTMHTQND